MKEKTSLWINLHRRDRSGRWPVRLMLWAMICSFAVGLVGLSQPFDDFMRDFRNSMRLQAASGDIVIVAIDDTSIEKLAKWPWPRRYHAAIVNNLSALGAEHIFLDIDFSSESNPVDDEALETALAANSSVTLPVHYVNEVNTGKRFDLLPIERFRRHSDLASINYEFGFMGYARKLSYSDHLAGRSYPSFAAKLAKKVGSEESEFLIDYSINPRTIPVISAFDIINNRVDQEVVSGKTVILGATSYQLRDLFLSPGYGFLPGVYLHVLGAETLKFGAPTHIGWLLPFALALSFAAAVAFIRDARIAIAATAAVVVALPLAPLEFERQLIFFDIMPSMILLLIVGFAFGWTAFRNLQRFRGSTNSLSGLPNFNALRHESPDGTCPLILLEIQNFAEVASALTAEAEGTLIKQIAHRIGVIFPASKLYQNDEGVFAWFAGPFRHEVLGEQLESLHHLFRTPVIAGDSQIDLTVACGVEIGSDRGIANRLGSARVAAEEALKDGLKWKNYDPAKLEEAGWKLSLLSQLDAAIDSGRLFVEFQPKLEIASGNIMGAEALARWDHPQKGLINPMEFILAAEQGGRIGKLTEYVLSRSIEPAAKINAQGTPFSIAVNLSARLLNEADLPESILRLLVKYNLAGSSLTLEITETAALAGSGSDIKALRELRDMGVQISIDDYGTGLSTLDYLKRIPATEIKIDKSFVQSIDRSHSDRVMVLSTIRLAHSLGQKVVAEGVERQETLDQLAVMGCDMAQGYFIGRPMSFEGLERILEAQREAA